MHPHLTHKKAVSPSLLARAKALLTRKPRSASLSTAPALLTFKPGATSLSSAPAPAAVNGHVSVDQNRERLARSTVEALGTADRLLQELRNAPSLRRDEKAREVCAALQATIGHDPSMANFRNERDPAKRAALAMQILTKRDKPDSVLRNLLASFHNAPSASERAALFPAVQLAAKKAGLLF